MNARDRHLAEIQRTQEELRRSHGFHKKDTFRRLVRLQRELKQFDLYRKEAKQ